MVEWFFNLQENIKRWADMAYASAQFGKIVSRLKLIFMSLLLSACSPQLSDEDIKQAKSLIMSNALCETMVKYRVGTVFLLARNGEYHRELANKIGDAIDFDVKALRNDLDLAFGDDLNDLFRSKSKDEYDLAVMEMFSDIQENIIMTRFGYSYPDCNMVMSMSESFITKNKI